MALRTMTGKTDPSDIPNTSRWEERDARRRANAQLAREAAERRARRGREVSLKDKVEAAAKRLEGANVSAAIGIIEALSPTDRDYYILAEKYLGPARKTVLQSAGALRGSVERQYLEEVGGAGVGDPESPSGDEGTQE